MRRIISTASLIFILIATVNAQDYKTGIGFRGGLSNGFTIKHFISESSALEAIITTRWEGNHFTGLYDLHFSTFDVPRLNWIYGFGGHIGFVDGDNKRFTDGKNHTLIGVDLLLGIEYSFEKLPISIGLDWKPYYDFIGDSQFMPDDTAISIRYLFGKS